MIFMEGSGFFAVATAAPPLRSLAELSSVVRSALGLNYTQRFGLASPGTALNLFWKR
jgi:hypothetical protein